MARTPELFVDGLFFPEGPRWRVGPDGVGRLWFSDVLGGEVKRADLAGHVETVAEVPGWPSGLGWRPDGTLLVVSVQEGRLMAVGAGGSLTVAADMKAVDGLPCNDMVVDGRGGAYVGSWQGLDESIPWGPGNMPGFSHIIRVDPDGGARIAADRMTYPNGAALSPDSRTYIVAETFANRLSAFDVEEDGSLTNRRVWADIGAPPDGITMDEEGCLWVAVPCYVYGGPGGYLRLREGGEIVDRIDVDGVASYACTLGGPRMRTLFLCQSTVLGHERHPGDGRIMAVEVDVPGTGTP
ncbi:MAG: SMP-30/gluconolactonase/LRE family protein [Gemmatimonadaceae bacterium]|nr:SMP-30/gluconolactonase/LRE family protein [Gemmatimonadaceae bacterium]